MIQTWLSSCFAIGIACAGVAGCGAAPAPHTPVEEAPIGLGPDTSSTSSTSSATTPAAGGGAGSGAGGLPTEIAGYRLGSTVASSPRLGAPTRSTADTATYNGETKSAKFEGAALKSEMTIKFAAGKLQSMEVLFDDASQCKTLEPRLKSKFGAPTYSAAGKTIWEQGSAGFELSCGPSVGWFTIYVPRH
jgi:hypothetical protein